MNESCDFTPLDFSLWGYVKAHGNIDGSFSIDSLEDKIEAFILQVPVDMLERMCQNLSKRMDKLIRSRGQYLHEMIFKHYMDFTVKSRPPKNSLSFVKKWNSLEFEQESYCEQEENRENSIFLCRSKRSEHIFLVLFLSTFLVFVIPLLYF